MLGRPASSLVVYVGVLLPMTFEWLHSALLFNYADADLIYVAATNEP